jgi:hypothetical protein
MVIRRRGWGKRTERLGAESDRPNQISDPRYSRVPRRAAGLGARLEQVRGALVGEMVELVVYACSLGTDSGLGNSYVLVHTIQYLVACPDVHRRGFWLLLSESVRNTSKATGNFENKPLRF